MKQGTLILSFTKNNIFFSLQIEKFNSLKMSVRNKNATVKGAKKINFLSLDFILQMIINKFKLYNLEFLHLKFIGKHKYQRRVIFLLKKSSVSILTIYNVIKVPHNGCSLKKV